MNSKVPAKVADDVVVSLDYTLTVDGEVLDSSEGNEPIVFMQGRQHIIRGLESELYEMEIGDKKTVQVAAKDGYGEFNPEAMMDVPREEFPPTVPMKVGTEIQVRDQQDETMLSKIVEIGDEVVKLDFNHPLAGKDLQFEVQVMALRAASAEELEHGHVHEEGHTH